MKQALYLMDEEILTPDLLKQLLTFTPNKQEVRKTLLQFYSNKTLLVTGSHFNIYLQLLMNCLTKVNQTPTDLF